MSPLVIIVTGLFCLFLTLILSYSQIHGATMLISYTHISLVLKESCVWLLSCTMTL